MHCPTVEVLKEDGSKARPNELGRIALKLPLPPGVLSTLYKADDRFKQIYFSKYPGYYDTMDAGYIDEYGYVYVTARDDDVINVAGHRLSTSALEDVVLGHPDVVDATVVGVPEATKGEIPLCLFVTADSTYLLLFFVYFFLYGLSVDGDFFLCLQVERKMRKKYRKS